MIGYNGRSIEEFLVLCDEFCKFGDEGLRGLHQQCGWEHSRESKMFRYRLQIYLWSTGNVFTSK